MQTLPNGYRVNGNAIYLLDDSDNLYLDDWVQYLEQDGTVIVRGQGGDDNISSGNVTLSAGPDLYDYSGISTIRFQFYGEDGDDLLYPSGGGSYFLSGGNGFDDVLLDEGPFPTESLQFSTDGNVITLSGSVEWQNEDGTRNESTYQISSDVEVISTFSSSYLIVDELLQGKVRYISENEYMEYRNGWEAQSGTTPDIQANPAVVNSDENTAVGSSIINIDNSVINIDNSTTVINNIDNSVTNIDNSTTVINSIDNSVSVFELTTTIIYNRGNFFEGDRAGRDIIKGGNGQDIVSDGDGRDRLIGGKRADQFLFDDITEFGKKEYDTIVDFGRGKDQIVFDESGLDTFGIAANMREAKALGSDIVYDAGNGKLFADLNGEADGFGNGGLFAKIKGAPELEIGVDVFGL